MRSVAIRFVAIESIAPKERRRRARAASVFPLRLRRKRKPRVGRSDPKFIEFEDELLTVDPRDAFNRKMAP